MTDASVDKPFRNRVPGSSDPWVTWTCTVTSQTGSLTTVTTPSARYVRLNGTIFYTLDFTITTAGTGAGELFFTLPINALVADGYLGSGRENAATGAMLQVRLASVSSGGILTYANASPIGSGRRFLVSGFYEPGA
jgi:hypothetical protein